MGEERSEPYQKNAPCIRRAALWQSEVYTLGQVQILPPFTQKASAANAVSE